MDNTYKYEITQKVELEKARAALQLLKLKKAQNSTSALPIYLQNSNISSALGINFNNNNLKQQERINNIYELKRQSSFQNNMLSLSKNAFYSNRNNNSNAPIQNFRNHNISAMSKLPPDFQNTYSKDNNSFAKIESMNSIGSNEGIADHKDFKDFKDLKDSRNIRDHKISNLAKIGQSSIKNISAYSTKTEMYDKRIEGFDRYPETNPTPKLNSSNINNIYFPQNIQKNVPFPTPPPASYKISHSRFNDRLNDSENEEAGSTHKIQKDFQNNSAKVKNNNSGSSKYKISNFNDEKHNEEKNVNMETEIFSEKEEKKNFEDLPICSLKNSLKIEVSNSSERIQCQYCERKFAQEALEKHENVCLKVFQSKRKQFNTKEKRVTSNEQVKLQKKVEMQEKPKKESNWKIKSQKFRQAISQLNQDSDIHVPIENPDYIKCEYCGRSFNENAAQRHIEFCAKKSKMDKFKEGGQKKPPKDKKK